MNEDYKSARLMDIGDMFLTPFNTTGFFLGNQHGSGLPMFWDFNSEAIKYLWYYSTVKVLSKLEDHNDDA